MLSEAELPNLELKVEENIHAVSLAKLKELVFSQTDCNKISCFFVGDRESGGCL